MHSSSSTYSSDLASECVNVRVVYNRANECVCVCVFHDLHVAQKKKYKLANLCTFEYGAERVVLFFCLLNESFGG